MLPTAADAARALIVAYGAKYGASPAPSQNAIVLPLAQILGEGSLSRYFEGTNNLGAIHATQSFATLHAHDAGYGMVAFLDHGPGGGAYVTRMSVYPTLSNGAFAVLQIVTRMVSLPSVSSVSDYAAQLYIGGYYEGFSAPVTPLASRAAAAAAGTLTAGDQANIASYAALIQRNVPAATTAYQAATSPSYAGDPSAVNSGPPFAALADRLTPSDAYAPHTLDHARTLLGAAADSPPSGAISLGDALAAPGGDGVWLFGSAAPAPAPEPSPAIAAASSAIGIAVGTAALSSFAIWLARRLAAGRLAVT